MGIFKMKNSHKILAPYCFLSQIRFFPVYEAHLQV